MKKILILLLLFLGLGAFVYFYEIVGEESRQEAEELEESLFRLEQDDILRVEINFEGKPPLHLTRDEESWVLSAPIEAPADETAVNALFGSLESARRERTFQEEDLDLSQYGLQETRGRLEVATADESKTLLIGDKDFSGNQLYVKFLSESAVYLTSASLLSNADKDLMEWRNKDVLQFERSQVVGIRLRREGEVVELEKIDEKWMLRSPLEEPADDSTVSSLLSTLEFAEVQKFVTEEADRLEEYGLEDPNVSVEIRESGSEAWIGLDLGSPAEENYFARSWEGRPIFEVSADLRDDLTQDLWEFRGKDLLDVEQDEIARLTFRRGEEALTVRREDYQWILEAPEEFKDREALAYEFWYPLDDLQFDAVVSVSPESLEPEIEIVLDLESGEARRYSIARDGDRILGVQERTGRVGVISDEDFEKLQFEFQDIVGE